MVTSVAFSPDGTRVISGSHDKTIQFWEISTGIQDGTPHWATLTRSHLFFFSPDGAKVLSGSADMTLRIWDIPTGGQIGAPLEGHTHTVTSVAISPDGIKATSDLMTRPSGSGTSPLVSRLEIPWTPFSQGHICSLLP